MSPPPWQDVVAAVICREDRFLLAQRPASKRHGGLWEFPGGKTAPGESLADALKREVDEELGVRLKHVGRVWLALLDPGSPFKIHFIETLVTGEPMAREHDNLCWVTLEGMSDLPMPPSDRAFVDRCLTSREG